MEISKNANELLNILPAAIQEEITKLSIEDKLEEIRMRAGRHCEYITEDKVYSSAFKLPTNVLITKTLQKGCGFSLYAYDKQLMNGYLTLRGGHRVGVTGRALYNNGKFAKLSDFSSLNIRFARAISGAEANVFPLLISNGAFMSTLILSPPGVGKTTLLRALTKALSNGSKTQRSYKVGVVDERGEIASCINGVPQLDVGERTDVFDGIDKSMGINMLIRSMSPEIIVTDEIGGSNDAEALMKASLCGVKILASCHAGTLEELTNKDGLKKIFDSKVFERYIFISRKKSNIYAKKIYNENFDIEEYV